MNSPRASEQLGFLGAATISPTGKRLTPKQERVWALVRDRPGGVTAEQVGACLHSDTGRHIIASPCGWCERDGLSVLRSKALRPLVIRRRKTGRFEARDGTTPPAQVQPSSQIRGLPDWLGGDAA